MAVTGNRSAQIADNLNSWGLANPPSINWGVGISARVQFGSADANIRITTAGADFTT
jgi:hypothetical protein